LFEYCCKILFRGRKMRKLIPLFLLAVLFLSGCDGSNPRQLPVINSFTANPANISVGQSSTLAWNVSGASTVTIDQGIGNVGWTGTRVVTPVSSTTYTLTASNAVGWVSTTAQVLVSGVGPKPPPYFSSLNFQPDDPLPDATEGGAYEFNFKSLTNPSGGHVEYVGAQSYGYSFFHGFGFPPIGLTLALNGILSGTPAAAGYYEFEVCVKDLDGNQKCGITHLTVNKASPTSRRVITAKSDSNCSIIRNGTTLPTGINTILVDEHSDTCFQIPGNSAPSPEDMPKCYGTCEVYVDGSPMGPLSEYCFNDVTKDHTITVVYTSPEPPTPNPPTPPSEGCMMIQQIGFSQPPPFTTGHLVKFGVTLINSCNDATTSLVQCYIDETLWDSGVFSLPAGQSITLWTDSYWMATTGSHTLRVTTADDSMSRYFTVNP
jgi:hypothetical protein